MNTKQRKFPRALMLGAAALGIAGGSYGVANAATGSSPSSVSPSSSSSVTSSSRASSSNATATASSAQQPWGGQRSDETLLTGDIASKVRTLALGKVSGGTVIRVETDADGHAAYEAHMTDASGNPVTVYVDKAFNVVSVESGGSGGTPSTTGASA